jgi:hypothetical protein
VKIANFLKRKEVKKNMSDVRNILVGAAQIFVSRGTNSNRPDTRPGNASGDLNWSANQSAKTYLLNNTSKWREVGYTNNGFEISYEPGYNDVMVDQLLDAARLFKSTLKVMLKTELTEGSLENVQLAFGQNEDAVTISSTGTVNTNNVLSFSSASTLDAQKLTIDSKGTASSQFAGLTTSTPVDGKVIGSTVTFSASPQYNVTRDGSGAVVAVTQVYGGIITSSLPVPAASITLLGTAQIYNGVAATSNQNVVIAYGASANAAANATLALAGGALGDAPVERSLVAVGAAPYQIGATAADTQSPIEVQLGTTSNSSLKERVYVARRVVQVDTTSHGLKRDAATVFPVSFRCLADDNDYYDGAEYGVIIDRVYGN